MSWKVEVVADDSGKWVGNALRFAYELEARAYAIELHRRWVAVREYRVVKTDDPVNERGAA